jgi:hypothetical protein
MNTEIKSNSKMNAHSRRVHFANFHVAGFSFYEGVLAFENLKIGKEVCLKPDPSNHYDKYAVEIWFGEHKLGFIPRGENKQISKLLQAGVNCFETRIQWVDKQAHPENQVGVIVYVVGKSV